MKKNEHLGDLWNTIRIDIHTLWESKERGEKTKGRNPVQKNNG